MKNSNRLPLRARMLLVLARVMSYLPVTWASAIGAAIGELVVRYVIMSNDPCVTRFYKNIEKLKGISSAAALKRRLIEYGRQTGRVYAEYTLLQKIDQQGHITIEGEENLGDLNKPVIFTASHLSNWELVGKAICLMNNPSNDLYVPIEDDAQMMIVNKARLSWCKRISLISTDSPMPIKQLIKKLSAGENLLIFSDEEKQGYIWGPLLGRKIPYTGNRWMIARLAVGHNVDVVPLCVQRFNSIDFKVIIGKRISVPSEGDKDSKAKYVADQIDRKLDSWIRKRPEHWFLIRLLDFEKEMPGRL